MGANMTKQTERVQKSTEAKLLDISKQDFEFVADLLGAWNKENKNFNKHIALELITQPETIRDLGQATENHNVKCFYALHAISIALRDVNCSDILNKMSDADIKILQKSITVAKQRSCPNKEALQKGLANSFAQTYVPSSRLGIENAANQKSMTLYCIIAEHWDDAITELNRWGDAVDNFERVVPPAKQWLTYEELRTALGFKNLNQFYKTKSKLGNIHPEIEEWFENHGNEGKLFNMAYFEKLKKLVDEIYVSDAAQGLWTLTQLADKMGLSGKDDTQKNKQVSAIKYAIKKEFPEVTKYFTPNRRFFYAEHFEDFQNLHTLAAQRKAAHKQTDPSRAIAIADLATKIGLEEKTLQYRIYRFFTKESPKRQAKVANWFVPNNGHKTKSAVKIEFVDQFIALFGDERKRGRPAKKNDNKAAKKTVQKTDKIMAPITKSLANTATDETKLYDKTFDNNVKRIVSPIKAPQNVQQLRTFDQNLNSWVEKLKLARAEQTRAEEKYNSILKMAQTPGADIDDTLQDLQSANTAVKAAAARVKEIQVQILNACKVQEQQDRDAFDAATEAKRVAEQNATNAEKAWENTKALIGRFAQEFGIDEK